MLETLTSVLALVLFLIPGYIWRTVEGQFVYLDKRLEWEKFALGLLARSSFIFVIFGAIIYRGWVENWIGIFPFRSTLLAMGALVLLPAIFGFLIGMARQWELVPKLLKLTKLRMFEENQIPTAWDYLFSRIKPCWAIITMQDGSKLYGYIGSDSYFSSDPDFRDFYISNVLRRSANGKLEAVPGSAGVYVSKERVSVIEFLKKQDGA